MLKIIIIIITTCKRGTEWEHQLDMGRGKERICG
jgi:hypothetical protein